MSDSEQEMPTVGREDKLTDGATWELDSEAHHDHAGESLISGPAEKWDLDEKYVETSILRLNIAMMKSSMRASEIDTRLRACQGHCDPDTVETCLGLLREDCIAYLAEQSEAAETFRNRIGELGELSALGKEIEMANLEQAAQVETTLSNLEYMDFHTDLEAASQRLLEEIRNLRVARDKLRDDHEIAFLAIARYENRLDKIEKRLLLDAITELHNRIGLETKLSDWWQQGLHQTRQMTALLFDIDRFGALNDKFGPVAGDLILCQLGMFIQTNIGTHDVVGRYAGQQFLAVLLDVGFHAAMKKAEFWRQSLERTVFLHKGLPIQITFSGAVAAVDPNDTYIAVLERLEKIIKEGKKTAPNRIFFDNGKEIEPVELPNMGATEQEIII